MPVDKVVLTGDAKKRLPHQHRPKRLMPKSGGPKLQNVKVAKGRSDSRSKLQKVEVTGNLLLKVQYLKGREDDLNDCLVTESNMYRGKKPGKEDQYQYGGGGDWYSDDDDDVGASAPYTPVVRGRESTSKASNKPLTKSTSKPNTPQTKGRERLDPPRVRDDLVEEEEEDGRLRQWIEDIEDRLSELKEELNIEDTPSSFITAYAKWHRRNVFYIDGLVILVLVVMFGIIIAGRYYDSSLDLDYVKPIPDKDIENRFQAIQNRIERNFKDLKSDLDSDISDFKDNEFSPLTSDFSSLRTEYQNLKINTEKTMNKNQEDSAKMTDENDEFKKNQNQMLDEFKAQQVLALENAQTQLEKEQKEFRESLETSVQEQQNEKIKEIENGIDKKVDNKIEGKMKDFQYGIKDMLAWKDEMNEWKLESEGRIKDLHRQDTDTNTMIILVVIIIMFIVVLVIMLMLRQRSAAGTSLTGGNAGIRHVRSGYEPSAILKQVKANCVNDNTVCVLHFNKESKDFCVKLTKTVEPDDHKLKPHLLDHHDDILTIPWSKVIIVYVEKNQRNIILEDPDQELGDLKRTTVEAALEMGATVVVVYMHHDESRNLGNNELYCPKLQSVTRHYVLSKLEEQGCVFSVYNSFSAFQKQRLKQIVSDSTKDK